MRNRRCFENTLTGEKLYFDKGDPKKSGHGRYDHYHRLMPDKKRGYSHVDWNYKNAPKGSDRSYIYPVSSSSKVGYKEKSAKKNVSKFDFHDGYLLDIQHDEEALAITLESSEISEKVNLHGMVLSKNKTIKGRLFISGIYLVEVNRHIVDRLLKSYDVGDVYTFSIKNNVVYLSIYWVNYPPKQYEETGQMDIEITAKKIWWENIPDLPNPFW